MKTQMTKMTQNGMFFVMISIPHVTILLDFNHLYVSDRAVTCFYRVLLFQQ